MTNQANLSQEARELYEMTNQADLSQAAKELHMYVTTNAEPMRTVEKSYRALQRFKASGTYDSKRAVDAMYIAAVICAQMYIKAHGAKNDRYSDMFSVADRRQVASVLVSEFQTEYDIGNRW